MEETKLIPNIENTSWEAFPSFLKDCHVQEITDVNGNIFYAIVLDEPKSPSSTWLLTCRE